MPLKGACQTVPRSELRAVLHSYQTAKESTLALSDCLFVVKGVRSILEGLSTKKLDHQEIWKQLQTVIESKPAGYFGIRKVKAHATREQLESGVILRHSKTS